MSVPQKTNTMPAPDQHLRQLKRMFAQKMAALVKQPSPVEGQQDSNMPKHLTKSMQNSVHSWSSLTKPEPADERVAMLWAPSLESRGGSSDMSGTPRGSVEMTSLSSWSAKAGSGSGTEIKVSVGERKWDADGRDSRASSFAGSARVGREDMSTGAAESGGRRQREELSATSEEEA